MRSHESSESNGHDYFWNNQSKVAATFKVTMHE